ncbi:PEGA domain-containing protein [Saccharophagus sp. K07]|jgi:hypothetical protein|uniref:Calx-beta domain-containing protein n=1 Tax=Saccharophagus sp. K07 TaxID=2283636 RepID=UPI001651CD92|nr:Calx-beta domain-containing protein [Saccharophagus sp. K07]MBC6906499.1 PEGA domain-containing protein [Saccharophagus sp. K07]
MKLWMIGLFVAVCLTGCSAQAPSTIDADLQSSSTPNQGKPSSSEWPYFDWDSLGDRPVSYSRNLWVEAGTKQYSDENLLVTLKGDAHSNNQYDIAQVRWWQHSGPAAFIINPNQLKTQVLLPQVAQPTTAVFRFAAINSNGEVNSDQVSVVIQPVASPVKVTASGMLEEEAAIEFMITLAQPAQEVVTFSYFTEDGTATAGEDYLSVSGIVSFQPGQVQKTIGIQVLQDNKEENTEYFYLHLNGEIAGKKIDVKRVGLIVDPHSTRNFLSSIPYEKDISPRIAESLPALDGLPRLLLQTENGADVRLLVEDPCGNMVMAEGGQPTCQGFRPNTQKGLLPENVFYSAYQNIAWNSGAAKGDYKVFLEHLAGAAVEYKLFVFGVESTKEFSGVIANGERIDIIQLWHEGSIPAGGNRVMGNLVNATNAQPIEQAKVRFLQDGNEILGAYLQANFDISLPEGDYLMEVEAEGYLLWLREITIEQHQPLNLQISLSPTLVSGSETARIVLSWGEHPGDLDSHLLGFGESMLHVSYRAMRADGARLDVDDTDAFGPETITIESWNRALYRYYVVDFSNQNYSTSSALANSNAVVQLYIGNEPVQAFEVPQEPGVIWHVFDYRPATNELTLVNKMVADETDLLQE